MQAREQFIVSVQRGKETIPERKVIRLYINGYRNIDFVCILLKVPLVLSTLWRRDF